MCRCVVRNANNEERSGISKCAEAAADLVALKRSVTRSVARRRLELLQRLRVVLLGRLGSGEAGRLDHRVALTAADGQVVAHDADGNGGDVDRVEGHDGEVESERLCEQ